MSNDGLKERSGSSSPVAERMRLYRERRRQGIHCVRIPLHVTEIDELVGLGLLEEEQRQNPAGLGDVVVKLFRRMMDELRDTPPWLRT